MNAEEFSNEFDIYYNNIMSNKAPGLDNYEKSVFLTRAQEDIVRELYNGRNGSGLSFESTEEARLYLRELNKEKKFDNLNSTNPEVSLDNDMWFITLEECTYVSISDKPCISKARPEVIPVRQDSLIDILDNPFRGPSTLRVLRADINGKLKLYSKHKIKDYTIHYIKKPYPIILNNVTETIDGKNQQDPVCELNPILHRDIIARAAILAKQTYLQ